MEWLDRIISKKGVVGIEVMPDGLAIAVRGCLNQKDSIDIIGTIKDENDAGSLRNELTHFIDKHKISRRLCNLVLSSKDYQLLLVEAPDVDDKDLRDAIKWRIKDLISMPLEKAVIDVFALPADANKSAKKMVYAVVSHMDRIQSLIDLVNDSGLTLSAIDIGEMAMRNLAILLAGQEHARSVGIVRLSEGGGVVSLYREGNLYLSRQFKIDYNAGLLDDLPVDTLSLEVQRSLDYYERQMGLAPPSTLYICGENVSEDKITVELTRSINVPVQHLDLNTTLTFETPIDEGMIQLCLGALGGVYRGKVVQ